ncbi:MAG: hypothetical protein KAR54_03195 [Candidatus Pacebacteria bacterium]|nr:hypothetical protein [Candidatus Paceibacterota bacterium]
MAKKATNNGEKRKYAIEKSAFIIAIVALVISAISSGYNIYLGESTKEIQQDTYRAIEPFQKPIIYFDEGTIIPRYYEDNGETLVRIIYNIGFSNRGKGIAHDIITTAYGTNYERPSEIKEFKRASMVNDIYPEMGFNSEVIFDFYETSLIINETKYFFVFIVDFKDKTTDEQLSTTLYQYCVFGKTSMFYPSQEEVNIVKPFLDKLINESS